MSRDTIAVGFDHGATGQKVPLVIYEKGVRKIIGEAFVHEDGKVDAEITSGDLTLAAALKGGFVIGTSLGPLPGETPDVAMQLHKEAGYPSVDEHIVRGLE